MDILSLIFAIYGKYVHHLANRENKCALYTLIFQAVATLLLCIHFSLIKRDNIFYKVPNKNLEMQLSLQCLKLYYFARFLPCYSKTVKPHTCVAALGKRRHRRWESAKRYQQDKKTQNCELVNESKLY